MGKLRKEIIRFAIVKVSRDNGTTNDYNVINPVEIFEDWRKAYEYVKVYDEALDEYQKRIKLMPRELEALPTYIKLAHAMHILLANYEKVAKDDDSEENEYWLEEGRAGLKQMI